jgi:hypothetical protein
MERFVSLFPDKHAVLELFLHTVFFLCLPSLVLVWVAFIFPYGRSLDALMVAISFASILLVAYFVYRASGSLRAALAFDRRELSSKHLLTFFVLIAASAAIPLFFRFILLSESGATNFSEYIGLSSLVLAVISTIGIVLTRKQMEEFEGRIYSFSDLCKRIVRMRKDSNGVGEIRVVAYTPAISFLSQPQHVWEAVMDALWGKKKESFVEDEIRTRMICLPESDVEKWHNKFEGIKRRDGVTIGADLIKTVNDVSRQENLCNYKSLSVRRLPAEKFPGCYFLLTEDRAIVVMPLNLPSPNTEPQQVKRLFEAIPTMIGFETTDRLVRQELSNCFTSLWSDAGQS